MESKARRSCLPALAFGVALVATACHCTGGRTGADSNTLSDETTSDPGMRVLTPGHPGVTDLTFEIRADSGRRPISPLIYGINFDLKDAANQHWGIVRLGGNRNTAYNWENNASNAGSDWMFQNDALMSESNEPAKAVLDLVDAATALSAPAIVTVSNADYVAADKNGGGDVRNSGPDYLSTRFKRNHPKKPTPLAPSPDLNDNAVYQDEFVAFLKAQRPNARLLFSMDNEPELWSHTHAEIFPKPVTYADLWRRNHDFAKATKDAWPGAEVLGFVSYGYAGLLNLQNASDANGRNFVDWYLGQAKEAEKAAGKRLIDYLDVHWYPEAQGGGERITGDGIGPEVVEARVQAPRSLWDAKYEEQSWVKDAANGPINLLAWLKGKIDAHYPGTKLAITEWNYGAGHHISGAIATADVLGIFGRHGVDLATLWPLSDKQQFTYAAFRAYRNYDGQGGKFGDTSIEAISSDVPTATVYASIEQRDPSRTVIIAINKAVQRKSVGITIRHEQPFSSAKVFVLSSAQPVLESAAALSPVATNAFKYEMPALSVSVIVPEAAR